MSERGMELLETADGQISELIDLLSSRGAVALSLPCSGREKVGDSTVAALALALHTAGNFLRIAGSLKTASQMPRAHGGAGHDGDRIPRLVPPSGTCGHADSAHDDGMHDGSYAAEHADLKSLLERLSAAQDALDPLADITDERLGPWHPPAVQVLRRARNPLGQVAPDLLNHQSRQLDALNARGIEAAAPGGPDVRARANRPAVPRADRTRPAASPPVSARAAGTTTR